MGIRYLAWALMAAAVSGPLAQGGLARDVPASDRAQTLITSLRARDVNVRRKAANEIRLSDRDVQRKALSVMIEALANERDGQVRLAVLDTLAALGRGAAAAVPALVQTLRTDMGGRGSEASHQDYRSALALAAIGKPAVEGLRGLLKERKQSVRAEAAMALGRIGPDAAAATADLVALLGDENDRIRREVSLALGRIGADALKPLIIASANNDVSIRAGAVDGLGSMSTSADGADRAIITCSHDIAPAVRVAAIKGLTRRKLADDTLLPVIKENVRHNDEKVRLAVVNLLVEHRSLLGLMASDLASLLTAQNDGVARHAAFVLGKLGKDAAPRLLNALQHDKSRIDQIAEALAQIGRPVAPLLAQGVSAPDPRVRRGAALALGQIRPLAPGTVQMLTAGLNDRDLLVQTAFLTAIGYLGPRGGAAVPAVRARLHDKSAEIRVLAVRILAQSAPRDERLVADLIGLLADEDARVQRQAIDILRSLGPPGRAALPAIIGKLNSKDQDVRLAAAEMVGSHGRAAAAAVPALCMLLDDPAPGLRTIAARTLGTMGKAAQPALARLTPLLGAPQVEVREAATSTLGSIDLEAEVIRPHLGKALRDDKLEVRRAAMKAIQRLGPDGAIFVPDIILMTEKKENIRSAERMLRRFERRGPDARSLPELVKQLEHKQETVRLLAIKFLRLAGQGAKDALPALERMRDDPSAEVRKQAEVASARIKNNSATGRQTKGARKDDSTG